jgi:hypothetical protein
VTEPDVRISGTRRGSHTSIKGASPTPPARQTNNGWNPPSSRNRGASGKSSSCTAPASPLRLKRTMANDRASRRRPPHDARVLPCATVSDTLAAR